jgi:hypothetical protein
VTYSKSELRAYRVMIVGLMLASCGGTTKPHIDSGIGADGSGYTDVNPDPGGMADVSLPNLDSSRSPDAGSTADGVTNPIGDTSVAGRDGAGPESSLSDTSRSSLDSGDLVNRDPDGAAQACTPEQEVLRKSNTDPMPFDSLPESVKDFLLTFLSRSYIEEHFRFYSQLATTSRMSYFDFVDGCLTATTGFVQWDIPICQGKIRYIGPAKEYRLLMDEPQAKKVSEAAGCTWSNATLGWNPMSPTSIPEPRPVACDGAIDYPAWFVGGATLSADPGMPAGSYCQAARCIINAETGAVSVTPRMCASPGKH